MWFLSFLFNAVQLYEFLFIGPHAPATLDSRDLTFRWDRGLRGFEPDYSEHQRKIPSSGHRLESPFAWSSRLGLSVGDRPHGRRDGQEGPNIIR